MYSEKSPLISVITTVYNTERYVERCFDSIMNQTYNNIEFIVVDNASTGNVKEIVENYQKAYPKRTIRLVELAENVGLFHGRLKGADAATGDYIAFIDSDDRISIDYYRLLMKKAIECNADMVATDFVYEDENGVMTRDIYNPMPTLDFEYHGEEILNQYLDEAATAFYWNLIWNKLYSRKLWNKSLPYLEQNTKKIVMCDDIAFTVVLYSQAEKYVNIHSPKYYYLRRSDANSVGNNDYKKYGSILEDILNVFAFFEMILPKVKNNIMQDQIKNWKERYYRIWASGIHGSELTNAQKKVLERQLREGLLTEDDGIEEDPQDKLFWNRSTIYNDELENIKRAIADPKVKYVSFDIFDTLLKRNLWEPFDLFQFMDKKFTQVAGATTFVEFSKIRSYCEHEARKKCMPGQDLKFDQIYQEIQDSYQFKPELVEEMKRYEIELELAFCQARETGKELFEMARYLGKQVICISDMYLPKRVIEALLLKGGYKDGYEVFVSSECGPTKANGKLFKFVFRQLNITNMKEVVHVGDNYEADILGAKSAGIKGLYLPKIQMVFCNAVPNIQSGKLFANAFLHNREAYYNNTIFQNLGSRSLMALIINRFFDNPFVSYMEGTEFNADPYYIGYFCVGFYMLEMCRWIDEVRRREQYKKLHFVSRDGYLLKKCYEELYPGVETNYLYTSREAMISLFFEKENDILGFSYFVYPLNYSPKKLIEILKPVLNFSVEKSEKLAQENDFLLGEKFSSKEQCDQFLLFVQKNLLSEDKLKKYRADMKKAFGKIIAQDECTVDVGYSGRPESILTKLLGYPVDALYMYSNADKAAVNSWLQDFEIFSNREYFPGITNEILLELFISDTDNSCKNLILKNGTLEPIFKDNKQNYATNYFIQCMQKGALEFVRAYKEHLSAFDDQLYRKADDMRYPLEYVLKRAPRNDFHFLSAAYFDDTMDENDNQTLQNLRDQSLAIPPAIYVPAESRPVRTKFQKAVYYLMNDHGLFKLAVKRRLNKHPVLFRVIRSCYKPFKAIRRVFRR